MSLCLLALSVAPSSVVWQGCTLLYLAPLRSLPLHCRLRFDGVFRIEILFVLCRNVASVGVTDCGVCVCSVCGLCCVAVVNQTAA